MTIADNIKKVISNSSLIRQMFEKGGELKTLHGSDNVFDFSIGNPNVKPPEQFDRELVRAAAVTDQGIHGYMPNTGLPETRNAIAAYVSQEQELETSSENIITTCGAAGGLNVTFKAILNPGEQVLVPSPYFVEYGHYASNSGGELITVKTREDFSLDLDAMESSMNAKTKIILVNTPNNPTGQIYDEKSMLLLGSLLRKKSRQYGHTIYLVSDEPYRKIIFDGAIVPSIFTSYENSIVITSYSKDISIPGERIGYIAINPQAEYREELIDGMALTNRTLGFVNAPALIQRVIARIQGITVNIDEYARKRKLLCDGLRECGYDVTEPRGTFYLFLKSPIEDDVKFTEELQKVLIIAVPGSAFGGPGYFRLAFCVEDNTIINSMPAFKKVLNQYQ